MPDRIELAGNTLLGGATNQGNSVQSSSTLLFSALPMGDARFFYAEEEITLPTGGATVDSTQKLLPATSIILGVSYYFTVKATGSGLTAVQFGDASTAARFGSQAHSGNEIAAGVSGVGATHLTTGIASGTTGMYQTAAASLRLTLTGASAATAGKVRVAVYGIKFNPPTA